MDAVFVPARPKPKLKFSELAAKIFIDTTTLTNIICGIPTLNNNPDSWALHNTTYSTESIQNDKTRQEKTPQANRTMMFHTRSSFGYSSSICIVLALATAVVFLASSPSNAFTFTFTFTTTAQQKQSSSKLCSSSTSSPDSAGEGGSVKPDLVDSTLFKAAINRVDDEIEAQYHAQKAAEGTGTEAPTEDELEWLAERARAKAEEANYIFLVGKLDVTLPIDTQPELDLTESIGPIVLVTSVWGRTAEATGMQEFDTLTKISVDDDDPNSNRPVFAANVKCTTLEETAGALTAAAQHAIALGKTEIQLEVQRLIKGYYAPEDS